MRLVRRVLAEKRGLIYPLMGAVLLNAALFVAVVYPLSLKVANGERDAQAAASAREAAQVEFDAAQATISGKDSADAELKKFYSAVLPPDQSAARRIVGKIDKLATTANVQLGQETLEESQERGSQLGKLTATVVLTGEYRNIRRFIHDPRNGSRVSDSRKRRAVPGVRARPWLERGREGGHVLPDRNRWKLRRRAPDSDARVLAARGARRGARGARGVPDVAGASAAPAIPSSNRRQGGRRPRPREADRPGRAEGQARGAAGEATGSWRGRSGTRSGSSRRPHRHRRPSFRRCRCRRAGRTAAAAASAAADSADALEVHGDGREAGADAGGADGLQGILVRGAGRGARSTAGTGWSRLGWSRSSSNIPTGRAEPPSERAGTVPSELSADSAETESWKPERAES